MVHFCSNILSVVIVLYSTCFKWFDPTYPHAVGLVHHCFLPLSMSVSPTALHHHPGENKDYFWPELILLSSLLFCLSAFMAAWQEDQVSRERLEGQNCLVKIIKSLSGPMLLDFEDEMDQKFRENHIEGCLFHNWFLKRWVFFCLFVWLCFVFVFGFFGLWVVVVVFKEAVCFLSFILQVCK